MRPALLTLALGLALSGPAFADKINESRVLGSIEAVAGQEYGELETVNGGIRIGRDARVDAAETVNGGIAVEAGAIVGTLGTVNGGISIGHGARVGSAETVNGGIRADDTASVSHHVETVNGAIRLAPQVTVSGNAETVNGEISLDAAKVAGAIRTTNGDITLDNGAEAGRLHVGRAARSWWQMGGDAPPTVTIGRNSVVHGELTFERDVKLWVHASARIGKVTGATAQRYEGDTPPREE